MFPQFNIHSTPLLILVAQGLVFAFLLFQRYFRQWKTADLLMALLLLVMAYHRTTYTIGFMGWYDTFQNTKINYYLFSLGLAEGPLIFLYVRTVLKAPFIFRKKDWWHFAPVVVFAIYRLIIWLHDANQEGWELGYEGEWHRAFHMVYASPIIQQIQFSSLLLYLAFTIQLFTEYKIKIKQNFSNTYSLELNWIQVFLTVYCFLFIYDTLTSVIDAFIFELSYVHNWWIHFFSAIAIVFFGIKAYFTNLKSLHDLTFDVADPTTIYQEEKSTVRDFTKEKDAITRFIEANKAYLQAEFTLKDLAKGTGMGVHEVSESINTGLGCNFNELINRYRVNEVKARLIDPDFEHLSILAIAYDSGFNSKASFNRIFKQVTGQAPSDFKKHHTR